MKARLGLFETMRAYHGHIFGLDEHIKRLKDSAKIIGLAITASNQELRLLVNAAVKKNRYKDQRVKLIACKVEGKTNILIEVEKYLAYPAEKYYKGFRAVVSDALQDKSCVNYCVKSLERSFYERAYSKAKAVGADEAIILNTRNQLAEATRSNIFLIQQGRLLTPKISCGCLPGITRRVIIAIAKKNGIKVYEGIFGIPDLDAADEAFLTNSLIGVMPLGPVGEITKLFMREYKNLLQKG